MCRCSNRRVDCKEFKEKHGIPPEEAFRYEFELLIEKNLIYYEEGYYKLSNDSIQLSQGIVRLFFSKQSDESLRKVEDERIDYQVYGVSYRELP